MSSIQIDDSSTVLGQPLDLETAWSRFMELRSQQEPWHYYRFLVKDGHLKEFEAILQDQPTQETPLPVGLWMDSAANADELARQMIKLGPELQAFGERQEGRVIVDRFYATMPKTLMNSDADDSIRECLDAVFNVLENKAPNQMEVFVSQLFDENWRLKFRYTISAIDYYNRILENEHLHPNLRHAGFCAANHQSVCTDEVMAALISACASQKVPLQIMVCPRTSVDPALMKRIAHSYSVAVGDADIRESSILEQIQGNSELEDKSTGQEQQEAESPSVGFSLTASQMSELQEASRG